METYFRYKRFEERMLLDKLQDFFNMLTSDGWEIIYYNENLDTDHRENENTVYINVIIVAGKKQNVAIL